MRRSVVGFATLALGACNAVLPEQDSGPVGAASISVQGGRVEYRAYSEPTASPAGWLRTVAVLRATGSRSSVVEYGGCPVEVQYFRTEARTGTPAWAQFRDPSYGCTLPLYRRTLAPGETLELAALSLPREVLGDSLPVGRYYVAAVVRPNGEIVRIAAGEVELTR